ncbi:MAG TPA: nucleotidyltransferase family protein [Edaphobacter sp.]|nr:nucleotidyltransferase family protein [Edaphobacter sp.]
MGHWETDRSLDVRAVTSPPARINGIASQPLRGEWSVREAALLIFCEPIPRQCFRLQKLSRREWRSLLHWLDISGLALYFLDRIVELKLSDWLPSSVLPRLQENLADNTERTRGMIAELIAIQQEFHDARLSYANLKGLSLWPSSVPSPELRSQFDLDFLIAEESAPEARRILEQRGYRLYFVSGRSWEFKFNEKPGVSLKDLYKALPSHAVELHIEPTVPGGSSPLERAERRDLYGYTMPVLSPVDLFLGQGLHAYKHVCSEFSRVAHLLEFRRHVLFHRDDHAFWSELRARAEGNPRASLGLGVVTLLIAHIMGDFAPEELTDWTVACLPRSMRLWVKRYGRRVVFGSTPGSKLYLLLQKELVAAGVPVKRSLRQILLPVRLPPPVIRAFPNETLSVRLSRYRMQLNFILIRLRFHIVEGLRYAWELHRWQRQIDRFEP